MSVFVVVLVIAFVLLGRWQLHRAHAQAEEDAQRTAATASAPVPVDRLLTPDQPLPAADEWRAVTATGTYDPDHQLLVRNRSMDSTNGYWVLAPLRTARGDLLVARGWIPAGATAEAPDALPTLPSGQVTVTGRLRPAESATSRAGLPAGQVERIVPSQLSDQIGRPTYSAWLAMESEQPPVPLDAGLRLLPADGSSGWQWPISHTVYALQWFTFGVIAVVGWFVLLRRDVRDAEPAKRPSTQDA